MTSLLGCGKRDFLTKCTAFFLPVHGQGVVDRLIAVCHPHVIAGHEELEFDMRAGIGDGIRILCQTFDLPDNVIAFLLVNAKGDLIALIMRLAFLSIPVVVILRLGRLRHNIGAHLINSVINLGVGVCNVVLTRRHLDVHIVAAGGGGNSFALVGAVQQGHLRVSIVIIFAGVGHRVLGGIVGKVLSLGRVADRILTYNNRTGLVLFAFLCNDGCLIATIRIRYLVDKDLALVYTGNALKLSRELTNALCRRADQRVGTVLVLDVGTVLVLGPVKVFCFKALKGQLFGGFAGLVYHNIRAVIAAVKEQSLAVCRKGSARISADRLAVDVRDRLGEGKHQRGIANAVNSGYICHGIAVDIGHNAVHATQLTLLLTGGKVCAVDAAKAQRIGNSGLAVITRQAAKDHGVLDDRCLRGIAGQLDIPEHTGGDLSVISQFDRRVEHTAGDGAGPVEGDFLLEVSAFNNGVIELDRSIGIHTGNRHVLQRDAIALQRRLRGVDLTRGQVYRAAVRAGDEDLRRGSLHTALVLAGHNAVLPTLPLIEGDRHATAGYLLRLHVGQVGQTVFGNAQGFESACIGGLVHQNICAIVVAGNAQHLAVGRGVGVVAADRCLVDAQHIGVQGKLCAACAHQIDGIGGKRQSTAVHRSHIAVAHHQLADLLSCGQQLLDAVRQFAQNRIRNGVGVIAIGIEIAALDHRIGDRARAIAVQGIKGAAGDLDRTVPIDRVDARADIMEGAVADLTAGDIQSAVFAKLTAGNIGIGDLDIAVDRHIAQQAEVEVRAALIQDLQNAFIAAVVGVAVITPAVAHVNTVQLCVRVQTVHIGHVGQIGLTLIVKAQFCGAKYHRNQLHGCAVLRRDHVKAGGKRFSVCADGDRGNRRAKVCKGVILGTGGQCHDTAAGRGYRPYLAAGVAFHCQLQIVPVTGIVILLDDIDFCFLLSVQGAALRQKQLVCLLLRVGVQAGDIAEKAAPDIAAVLSHLIVGAAVNSAQIQLHIGVAAAQNVDAVHIVGLY